MAEPECFQPLEILADKLRTRILRDGPLSIAAFMNEALFDPMAGFYATKDPLTAGQDFITAPEITQMFGELIGLWSAQVWMQMDAPDRFHLVELGPGTGRMMSDILRAGRSVPGFCDAAQLSLIEASPALKMVQSETLGKIPVQIGWKTRLQDVDQGPVIILGNEFLDCLPIRQAVRHKGQWRERVVAIDPDKSDQFVFALGGVLSAMDLEPLSKTWLEAHEGALIELRASDAMVINHLEERFTTHPGYALFIDYGSDRPEFGDTLQAIRAHEKVSPLDQPGSADLTSWVFFDRLAKLSIKAGLQVFGPTTQADFLTGLGINQRMAALAKGQDTKGQAKLARQMDRLIDPNEMGDLFKVIAITSPGLPPPPGLNPYTF